LSSQHRELGFDVSFLFRVAFGATEVLSSEVPVNRADAERGADGEVRDAVVAAHGLDQTAAGPPVADSFAQEAMKNGTTGVLGLQTFLMV